ncbi:MAG TPA: 2'-5' RNA ligase family protein [Steroidobacteraceae bacterium]|nr:2'-5' RNA ligase family protein [Steroidobacteraceae bacterium]
MITEEPPGEAAAREPSRRLFFALWPDEAMRQAMEHATRVAARATGGRPVATANLHVTLAFLGAVPERRLPQLSEVARAAAFALPSADRPRSGLRAAGEVYDSAESPCELTFDQLEYWRAARLLCALPSAPPESIVALARRLQERLIESGFTPDRKPFRPHVTLARNVVRPALLQEMQPVVWHFAELALVESRTLPAGPAYRVLQSFSTQ